MEFPLYNQLTSLLPYEAGDMNDKWMSVMNLPLEQSEIIFALIWHYYKTEETSSSSKKTKPASAIPYKGKLFEAGKGVLYQVTELPDKLKQIISLYIKNVVSVV
jgi:hypothetical protein